MNYRKVLKEASQLYINHLKENRVGFCPPPENSSHRDKGWSRILKETWSDFHVVKVTKEKRDGFNVTDVRNELMESDCSFWFNYPATTWYFDNPEVAIYFKLRYA